MLRVPKTINPLGWTIVCVSDTHSKLHKIENFPPGDIIIHGGDFSNIGELPDIERFHSEFSELPYPVKIFIAGNHDLSLDRDLFCNPDREFQTRRYTKKSGISVEEYHTKAMNVVRNEECPSGYLKYLHDESCEVTCDEASEFPPLKVYGSPWQPEFFSWAFNLTRGPELAEKWAMIPTDTDVLITHGPPHGILDKTSDKVNAGCEELSKLFDTGVISPRIHIFGHIHEGYGATRVGGTVYCNASTCTLSYRPTNKPIVLFVPFDRSKPAEILTSFEADV
mmetsp:Transcript_16731/g.18126  ORF Transcript_16731/g.18126 Transcript_16731/m.18126 type:complete len:280 (-) Transcript_16731:178-1017(-)